MPPITDEEAKAMSDAAKKSESRAFAVSFASMVATGTLVAAKRSWPLVSMLAIIPAAHFLSSKLSSVARGVKAGTLLGRKLRTNDKKKE